MINFRTLEINDREWISKRLEESGVASCEYTFVNNFIWGKQYKLYIADINGFYCSRCGEGDEIVYGFPVGKGDVKTVLNELMEDAVALKVPLILRGLVKEQVELLEELYPEQFQIESNREEADYLYSVERLSTLAGKKLHGKRNHIARFKDNPNWSFEEISADNIEECLNMNKEWCALYNCNNDPSLKHEYCAVKKAFANYEELKLVGGLLRLDGRVVAYTVGSRINDEVFDIHIEKAFAEIQGAYPMINQQFVLNKCQGYKYVNREEDLGDEGLRKAKLSYYPDILLEKFTAKKLG